MTALEDLPISELPTREDETRFLSIEVPETLPILPLRNAVLYPLMIMPVAVGRPASIRLIEEAYEKNMLIGVATQRHAEVDEPDERDLYKTGTVARIIRVIRSGKQEYTVFVQGIRRYTLLALLQKEPYLIARVQPRQDIYDPNTPDFQGLVEVLRQKAMEVARQMENIPDNVVELLHRIESPLFLINLIANHLDLPTSEKIELLEEDNYARKAEQILEKLIRIEQIHAIRKKLQEKVSEELEKQQRQFVLQQQLRTIQEELGMEADPELERIREKLKGKKLPEYARQAVDREIQRLKRIHPSMPEYSVILNWLELVADLPWNQYTKDNYDLERAEKILDRDHYDLKKVKRRILEYLAVLQLKKDMKAPILLFVGPPGVGKTSLGRSIAEALGRKFVRISLGGLHDEAEIRGHRRTYIGAYPGRIIQSLRKVNSANPVFMLDEIDKIGRDFRGDPASALLEVLDPEQNHSFYDNYLEMEFDLSRVLFIATANTTATIHPALLDRMEIIEIGGYSTEQKIEIARRHLIPKLVKEHGLEDFEVRITPAAIRYVIERYTRESGVRNLEKQLAGLLRYHSAEVARHLTKASKKQKRTKKKEQKTEEIPKRITVTRRDVRRILGPEPYEVSVAEQVNVSGVAIGLAWTPAGGDILFIEATLFRGKGNLLLTGSLGDIMKESATTALSWLKAHAPDFQINPDIFQYWDVHIHVPEGAIPKDGPSAGVAILAALTSLFTQRQVRSHFAMTGEITLRGKVLPVGGIREKLLAARRAGITDVILPKLNKKDLEELDDEEKKFLKDLRLHFVDTMREVLDKVLVSRRVVHPIDLEAPLRRQSPSSRPAASA